MKITLLLNNNLNFIFLKKNNYKYIIIHNKLTSVYIKYKFDSYVNIYYLKNLKCILIELNFFNTNKSGNLALFLNKQIKSINFYFIKKIIFFGKGFKIKKNKKEILSLFFNKSHLNFFFWNNLILKKLKKTKLIFCSSDFVKLNQISNKIINIRKLNIFTKKGLRLSRQLIFKKVGKKTT